MKFYTGIGSRETPQDVLTLMYEAAIVLCDNGWTLRSGRAPGADTAFEKGALAARPKYGAANTPVNIFLPWEGFEGAPEGNGWDYVVATSHSNMEIAKEFHPAWDRLKQGGQKLMARDVAQILGREITNLGSVNDPDPEVYFSREEKSRYVICWTKDGGETGGTGQVLRMAAYYDIPIFNLYHAEARKRVQIMVDNA